MSSLFAQIIRPNVSTWGFGDFLIAIIVVAGCIAITYIALRVFGVEIPQWVAQIFWVVIAVCVAVFAIRFILGA